MKVHEKDKNNIPCPRKLVLPIRVAISAKKSISVNNEETPLPM
jgi:hypothetical protein